MNFAEILKKNAEATGMEKRQGESLEVRQAKNADKPTTMSAFADALKKNKIEAPTAEVVTIDQFTFETGPVSKWSFSTLKNYEGCPYLVKLAKIDKIPQKDSPAADRGSMLHLQCENYIMDENGGEFPTGDRKTKFEIFRPELDLYREKFATGEVEVEGDWGIRKDWSPCTWQDPDLWGRGKLDVFYRDSETSCQIIDWKSGRKFGNGMKHSDQGLSYALMAAFRYPELETFAVKFAYIDQGEWMRRFFTRDQLMIMHPRLHKRAKALTTETKFQPKCNPDSCRFCPYGSNKSKAGVAYGVGICEHDHYKGLIA